MGNGKKYGYEYLWAVSGENIKFISEEGYSPYLEINGNFLNEYRIENEINVNPFIRFNNIFSKFLEVFKETEKDEHKELKKRIVHEVSMCLREMDYVTGTTVIDIYCENILKDIERGDFGDELMRDFKNLTEKEKNILVLLYYDKIVMEKESFSVFCNGIKYFFPDSIIYQKKHERKKVVIYINSEKKKENRRKVKIMENLFLPLGVKVKYYWENHFGVINVEKTLKLGEVSVF
ncbi:hypothetical protein [Leptotrichia sp. oral taxon 212]|jgi:hypothetical protein|uniref:hypothetical protein n=1 Tax=Leptotrichia sp. oral taxon 212 TaxID=712357 RepID=UPI0006A99811|nr:hypothetical protein [Leptotrichia sp. oral taxon 212]ALA95401.1 hypothetical protein AMK43_04595 [Leptotrichia sp. oral taxon 212]